MSSELLREIHQKLETITIKTQALVEDIRAGRNYDPPMSDEQVDRPKGLHARRLPWNRYEAIAAAHWTDEDRRWNYLGALMTQGDDRPAPLTDRDRIVAATLIQWLGSPVGRAFLREMIEKFSAASPRKGEW